MLLSLGIFVGDLLPALTGLAPARGALLAALAPRTVSLVLGDRCINSSSL